MPIKDQYANAICGAVPGAIAAVTAAGLSNRPLAAVAGAVVGHVLVSGALSGLATVCLTGQRFMEVFKSAGFVGGMAASAVSVFAAFNLAACSPDARVLKSGPVAAVVDTSAAPVYTVSRNFTAGRV